MWHWMYGRQLSTTDLLQSPLLFLNLGCFLLLQLQLGSLEVLRNSSKVWLVHTSRQAAGRIAGRLVMNGSQSIAPDKILVLMLWGR